ncbi:MAG: NAD(P)/FAD-dependent oxidoreductase [Anaerolineales bacterium]
MAERHDAIVIGGGHNGLVNAAYLARAGLRVLVLEQRHALGGATVSEEVYPGFKFSVFSYVVSLLRPEVIRDLDLPRHGLTMLPLESTLTPLPDGRYLYRGADPNETFRNIARFSHRDAEAYREYGHSMYQMAKAVKYILGIRPPDPTSFHPGELLALFKLGRHFLGLGEENLYTLVKLMTMSSADFLEEWFETDPLIATLSASGIIGTFLGPRSPGSAYVLLHHYMGEIDGVFRAWGFQKGGTGGVAEAIAKAARELGAELRTNARVAKLLTRNGRAAGVVLENGDEIHARLVVSSLDPKLTFLKLADPQDLPDDLVSAVRNFDTYGSSGKVNLALDAAPDLSCLPGDGPHLRGAISISPSVDYIERAYDDAKYGRFSQRPYIDAIFPSMIDPGMAPPGKHVMSCFVQYAPYKLAEGDWESQREGFGDAVVNTLSEYIPNLKKIILHRQVLSPWDMEQNIGLSGGNIFQGELSLSQLFFLRPAPGYAQYRTPIRGYYQCGSGTHPGGGITGAPGRLAALEILRDLRK